MSEGPRVTGIDHMVLNVRDVEASLAFYIGELGLAPVRVEEWRRGECGFPSARASGTFIIDFGVGEPYTGRNLNHFCLLIEEMDLDAVAKSDRFRVKHGPVKRYGAQGDGISLYVFDPDDNEVELRYYP